MEGANNRSSDALRDKVSKNSEEIESGNRDEKAEKIDEQKRVSSASSSDYALANSSRGGSKASQLQNLASVELPAADFDDSSDHLSEVPVEYSLQSVPPGGEMKDQVKAVKKGLSEDIGGKCSASSIKSSSSIASSNPRERKLQSVENGINVRIPKQEKQNLKRLSIVPMPRSPSDGYNWRKYGQKQVKSPEGSRSYYRCTFSDCCAKKIECCDISNRQTVYKSHHNHEPPQKLNSIRENRPTLSTPSINGTNDTSNLVRHVNDLVPSTPSEDHVVSLDEKPETSQESSGSDETTGADTKELHGDGPVSKKRQKRNSTGEVESLPKPEKKPKYVVHAAGDVGISGDGYRWRKYGQKMVKGNPHPRNYYRCTSAGCPVRKHIEREVDNSSAVVITYKGIHDHDTPVPRKCRELKNGSAIATFPISLSDMQSKSRPHKDQQTQRSVDKEGELTGEALVGGDKASESARTLLSVGFEIKPC
ncbi:WRKY transcription factor, variant 2 [Salvia divinorum]|uniref:WRKY transcription factor, variant 2 n=1 Tax=Salvia divinorum TaxID=28513 RepID=A0ABD1I444_SALDI